MTGSLTFRISMMLMKMKIEVLKRGLSAIFWATVLVSCGGAGDSKNTRSVPPVFTANIAVEAQREGFYYAYGPAILRENEQYHMWYCSWPTPGNPNLNGEDYIRYSTSRTGGPGTWSTPTIALQPIDSAGKVSSDFSTCDPSVIKYQAPGDDRLYYYLFYSGHPIVGQNRYTHVYVARSLSVSGPWEKWNGSGWVVGESNPAPIIAPRQFTPVAPEEFVYGAGEQTVVVNPSGGLTMTYWDDTTCYPEYCPYEYTVTSSGSVTAWSTPIKTNLTLNSIDMKYDKAAGQYVAVGIDPQISNVGVMYKYTSLDAITWNQKAVIGSVTGGTLPNHPSNAGLSGDISGHLLPDSNFIGYAADYPGSACPDVETYGDCWGRWDLYQAPFKSEP